MPWPENFETNIFHFHVGYILKKENVIKQNSWLPSEWTIHNFLCVGTDFGWQTPHESREI